jgi:hypothetical protein
MKRNVASQPFNDFDDIQMPRLGAVQWLRTNGGHRHSSPSSFRLMM